MCMSMCMCAAWPLQCQWRIGAARRVSLGGAEVGQREPRRIWKARFRCSRRACTRPSMSSAPSARGCVLQQASASCPSASRSRRTGRAAPSNLRRSASLGQSASCAAVEQHRTGSFHCRDRVLEPSLRSNGHPPAAPRPHLRHHDVAMDASRRPTVCAPGSDVASKSRTAAWTRPSRERTMRDAR